MNRCDDLVSVGSPTASRHRLDALMKIPRIVITKNAIWTAGAFGILQIIRLATSVVLTRLLAPELFGIMVIVNSLKAGIELLTDVGIGQSIIYNRNAEDSDFYNTAWTLAA